ncbi:hypothetical protein DLE60_08815 [Micromonospora globispora]|uniref:hypothetical protein n=1 Tax=Micromonospora globispora TaxID=1450148 RepID=UPI000D70108A|nr:hypothetical protein [Micromonospora globispora]PWU60838.1 hypothetical protein DLE60_08815 [Micromonospora globispora]RQW95704.1 hypothetical protein DKL51_14495 [Micromonospora globispora]
MERYCRIFVRSADRKAVRSLVRTALHGSVVDDRIDAEGAQAYVGDNGYRDPQGGEDFLDWPLCVELHGDEQVEVSRLVTLTRDVLTALWAAGVPAVAAADYEAQLPDNGGIGLYG